MAGDIDEFKKYVRKMRTKEFLTPFDFVYDIFIKSGADYYKKDKEWFRNNASKFVMDMRDKDWDAFSAKESRFTIKMLKSLIDNDEIEGKEPLKAVEWFIEHNPEEIYSLSLSNTQSRRSRAGKEFEAIIELMLIGADIPCEVQSILDGTLKSLANKNKKNKNSGINDSTLEKYKNNGPGKAVDFVSPGVVQYMHNKSDIVLISAKTTLRERWQEVNEEAARTGVGQVYLATLDNSVTDNTTQVLYGNNIFIATTEENKKNIKIIDDSRVFSFEEMIERIDNKIKVWEGRGYTDEDINIMSGYLNNQIKKHKKHPYVEAYYKKRLAEVEKLPHRD